MPPKRDVIRHPALAITHTFGQPFSACQCQERRPQPRRQPHRHSLVRRPLHNLRHSREGGNPSPVVSAVTTKRRTPNSYQAVKVATLILKTPFALSLSKGECVVHGPRFPKLAVTDSTITKGNGKQGHVRRGDTRHFHTINDELSTLDGNSTSLYADSGDTRSTSNP